MFSLSLSLSLPCVHLPPFRSFQLTVMKKKMLAVSWMCSPVCVFFSRSSGHACELFTVLLCVCVHGYLQSVMPRHKHTLVHTHTRISTVLEITLFLTNQRMVSYSSVHALCKYVEWEGKKKTLCGFTIKVKTVQIFFGAREKKKNLSR